MEDILAEGRTQTGKKVPRSRKEIYKAWREFKSVTHFWAAFYLKFPQDQVEGLCTAGAQQARMEASRQQFTTHLLSTNPPVFLVFLALSEWFRHWGSNQSPQHQRNPSPWLDPITTWRCEVLGIQPDRLPFVDATVAPLTDDAIVALSRYKANARF
jgi:hypothetical protein